MVLGEQGQGAQPEPQKEPQTDGRKRKCAAEKVQAKNPKQESPFKLEALQSQSVRPVSTKPIMKMRRTEIHIDGKSGQIKKALIPDSSPETVNMIKNVIKQAVWPWSAMHPEKPLDKQLDIIMESVQKDEAKLDIILGSTTPDLSHDDQSGSDYKPVKSEGNESSDSWSGIQAKVNQQLAREE